MPLVPIQEPSSRSPVNERECNINSLAAGNDALGADIADQIAILSAQIDAQIEAQSVAQREQISDLSAQIDEQGEQIVARIDALEEPPSQSPVNERECNINSLAASIESQGANISAGFGILGAQIRQIAVEIIDAQRVHQVAQIADISALIDHLDKAVRNINGLHGDRDEYTATPLVHSITEQMPLVLTQQPSSESPVNERKCNIGEINSLAASFESQGAHIADLSARIDEMGAHIAVEITHLSAHIYTQGVHQAAQIADLSTRIDHLDEPVRDINGFHEHKDDHDEEYTPTPLVHSCEEIKTNWPDSPSDHYTIADSGGHTRHVYCHMEELCGSDEGWMRVAYLNMADPFEKCPEGLRLYEENGVRACCRPSTSSGGCVSSTYPSKDISYSQICGKVIGYQFGSTDGTNNNDINGAYIDGISLTHGNSRNHIWSFIAGYQESVSHSGCPCGTVNRKSSSSFVGNDYFCESAVPFPMEHKFYPNDLLWDGKGCGSIEEPCCWVPGLPWFQKTLGYTTTDYIEMRLCCDEGTNNEDVLMSHVELYIR